MANVRIDKLLHDRGLAESRTKAQAMVMAGVVLVGEKRVDKPSEAFAADAVIRIKGDTPESRYVGRGGLKLEKALAEFGVDPTGMMCVDIGASTGGFTECLLQHGARRVVAIDVGTNQLDWRLRNDPRVDARENLNARGLQPEDIDSPVDLIVMDVSFISVKKIMPVFSELMAPGSRAIVLIKPQFEVGKGEVGKGGIVREPEKHERVVAEVTEFASTVGLKPGPVIESPILGKEGNKEFLAIYERA
ncbi:MAG: TlyA family RNA methyltransferase [Blastocatellia bacterium]|nr:TlyA family RNA methyltransferase [Blastocatellia bacterium]